jgi:hypothetical protein
LEQFITLPEKLLGRKDYSIKLLSGKEIQDLYFIGVPLVDVALQMESHFIAWKNGSNEWPAGDCNGQFHTQPTSDQQSWPYRFPLLSTFRHDFVSEI